MPIESTAILREIEAQVEQYRRTETECRLKRETLEALLRRLTGRSDSPSGNGNAATRSRRGKSQAILQAVLSTMVDGETWQLGKLIAAVQPQLGFVASPSTVRAVLKECERIKKIGFGVFQLIEKGPEAVA